MKSTFAILFLIAGLLSSCQSAGSPGLSPTRSSAARPYPLVTCLVCDDLLDDSREVVQVHGGQELKFCSPECLQRFKANPSRALAGLPRVD